LLAVLKRFEEEEKPELSGEHVSGEHVQVVGETKS
jgi:hypothetical protein